MTPGGSSCFVYGQGTVSQLGCIEGCDPFLKSCTIGNSPSTSYSVRGHVLFRVKLEAWNPSRWLVTGVQKLICRLFFQSFQRKHSEWWKLEVVLIPLTTDGWWRVQAASSCLMVWDSLSLGVSRSKLWPLEKMCQGKSLLWNGGKYILNTPHHHILCLLEGIHLSVVLEANGKNCSHSYR